MSEQDNLSEIFRDNLQGLIAKKDVTQKELAEYMQVSPATISHWLAGQKLPRMGKIDKLCKYFGVERTVLLSRKETQNKSIPLNAEETKLIDNYRDLNFNNKQMVLSVISAFLTQQAAAVFNNVTQNNNGNGNFFANTGDNYLTTA